MPKLYYKNEYRGELAEQQANKIRESLDQKPKPTQLTINGELLEARKIEIFKDDPTTASIQDNKDFQEKRNRMLKEIEAMRTWDLEKKVLFNISRNFSVKYSLQVGYAKYLGADWDKGGTARWCGLFTEKYKAENPENYKKLYQIFKEYFEINPDQYWCNDEIFKSFLPAFSREKVNNII
jgi:hypothetical protein